ncbi:unnamed protein product [Vitrella brassicaformis CCMP3155]|uniref:Uncharacterized protein n=1 Tax=Vitrella brassicaformis (strain CCMP3155) TaxID=1169540 RepID=A0A0G4FXI6_VITBC|nr:unnamed protein product [Vitrella brassicaformis CCMP3155]|eukprot:CEM19575.1 unnamed protein product [Vitrella brassicaformis CCMP3155]
MPRQRPTAVLDHIAHVTDDDVLGFPFRLLLKRIRRARGLKGLSSWISPAWNDGSWSGLTGPAEEISTLRKVTDSPLRRLSGLTSAHPLQDQTAPIKKHAVRQRPPK